MKDQLNRCLRNKGSKNYGKKVMALQMEDKMLTIDSILWLISVKFLEASLPKSSYSLSLVNDNVL